MCIRSQGPNQSSASPGGPVRLGRVAFVAVLVMILGVVLSLSVGLGRGLADPGLRFGVLGSRCDSEQASVLQEAGVTMAEVRVDWQQFEPAPGVFSDAYRAQLEQVLARCRTAGLTVALTPGFNYAPGWVARLPGGAYRDQYGDTGPEQVPNLIFSVAARQAATDYVAKLATLLRPDTVSVIRLGTGESGELGFPGRPSGQRGNSFWAFDAAAQTGTGLAAGATASPLPGWVPGAASWNGRPVSPAEVRTWFQWYAQSAVQGVSWQIELFRQQGFQADFHLPLAGRGVLPGDLDAAVADYLGGAGDRDGSLERGLYYPQQLKSIAAAYARDRRAGQGSVVADVTGLDDATAVAARNLSPAQDSCQPGDAQSDLLTKPDVVQWSSFRWTVANARQAGLFVVGENPGSPDAPGTGGDATSDPLEAQVVHAPRYAKECGLAVLMWAFEEDFFHGDGQHLLDAFADQVRSFTLTEGDDGRSRAWFPNSSGELPCSTMTTTVHHRGGGRSGPLC